MTICGPWEIIREPGYQIWILQGERLDPEDDNVDVEVRLAAGETYFATFFTIKNIASLFAKNKVTGECAGGLYFYTTDMVIVERLTVAAVRATIRDLIAAHELGHALTKKPEESRADAANEIADERARIERYFNAELKIAGRHQSESSPSGRYTLDIDGYHQDDAGANWNIAVAAITERQSGEEVARLKCDDADFRHCWIERDGVEYLICAEAFWGQTVVDVTHKQFASYVSYEHEHVATLHYYPSPDKRLIAVDDCCWDVPWSILVYDFSRPLELPLELKGRELLRDGETFKAWASTDSYILADEQGNERVVQIVGDRDTRETMPRPE